MQVYAIVCHACAMFEQNLTMHVQEMVEDMFKEQNGRQSAVLYLISKENDVHMKAIICYLCAMFE